MTSRFPHRPVVLAALVLLLVPAGALWGQEEPSENKDDEDLLNRAGLRTDNATLLRFLQQRSLSDARRQQLEQYILDLGSPKFPRRQRATRELITQGSPALSFLRSALHHPDVEVVRRAQRCIHRIQQGPGADLSAAAVRLLVHRHPARAIPTLLTYLPFADDDAVAEEVVNGLLRLSRETRPVDPALVAALHDRLAARRGTAAFVLAQVGDEEQRSQVRRLLADPDVEVRFRSAHGLAAAKDATALPVLIRLVKEGTPALALRAEDLLTRIAGDQAPAVVVGAGADDARQRAATAWESWWRQHGKAIDWKQVEVSELGGGLVAELETEMVWEAGPRGKTRWEVDDLRGPYDVRGLAGGRLLIAEYTGQRVSERDRQGKIHWKKEIDSPISCRRLRGGNTFIATARSVLEVGPDGAEIYAFTLDRPRLPLFAAEKLRGSPLVAIACGGGLLLLDTSQKKLTIKTLDVGGGQVADVQEVSNGNLLVTLAQGKRSVVKEITRAGKAVWEAAVPQATSATRLATGNVLVASSSARSLMLVDAAGKVLWKKATAGRPIRVHRR